MGTVTGVTGSNVGAAAEAQRQAALENMANLVSGTQFPRFLSAAEAMGALKAGGYSDLKVVNVDTPGSTGPGRYRLDDVSMVRARMNGGLKCFFSSKQDGINAIGTVKGPNEAKQAALPARPNDGLPDPYLVKVTADGQPTPQDGGEGWYEVNQTYSARMMILGEATTINAPAPAAAQPQAQAPSRGIWGTVASRLPWK